VIPKKTALSGAGIFIEPLSSNVTVRGFFFFFPARADDAASKPSTRDAAIAVANNFFIGAPPN
jgi:hypothetical protein